MLFAKAWQNFETCSWVGTKLHEKLVASLELPIIVDDKLKVTPVLIFVIDFNLSS